MIHAKKKTVAGCFTVFDTVFFKSYCYNICAVVRFWSLDVACTRRYNNDDYLEISFRCLSVFYTVTMYNSAIIINLRRVFLTIVIRCNSISMPRRLSIFRDRRGVRSIHRSINKRPEFRFAVDVCMHRGKKFHWKN